MENKTQKKYLKHAAFGYGYRLVCVDDNFGYTFKTYLGWFKSMIRFIILIIV